MKRTRILMGMPITVEILDPSINDSVFTDIYTYFSYVDHKYSTYKKDSEISQINRGLPETEWSQEMTTVLQLCEQTKQETEGYFNIFHNGQRDPSGLVKGWAIQNAANILLDHHISNFCLEAGGDIQVHGLNDQGTTWRIGIRNPFDLTEVVKVVTTASGGVATSGTYIRGQHIYNPRHHGALIEGIVSLTVIGPSIYDADRFATAAFAMGKSGIEFLESLRGYEGYMIDSARQATLTSGFEKYVVVA